MVDDDSLACRQRQSKQSRNKPVNVHYGGDCMILANSFIWKEESAVKNQNHVCNLAAEPGNVADHHKSVGVLDRLTQLLMSSTKFSDATLKLASAADGAMEILI